MSGDVLSKPHTKSGRLQRACLELWEEHKADGALPTSLRFLFYELEGRGIIPKAYLHPDGTKKPRQPHQDVSAAFTVLREAGLIPWDDIVDEERTAHVWRFRDSVYEYAVDAARSARIDSWDGKPPPLILCESKSLSGVLKSTAGEYLTPIAATKGQSAGFLRTRIAPLVNGGRRVIYFGDFDLSGGHIEANTRRVLEEYGELEWERLAITEVQVQERGLTVIQKRDHRYKGVRYFDAVETEALSQRVIQRLLVERLDELLPEPLSDVQERQRRQRREVEERFSNGGAA